MISQGVPAAVGGVFDSTGGPAPRGQQPGLSPSEIITLLLVHHSSGFKHLKSFCGHSPSRCYTGMPYEHFVAPAEAWWSSSSATWGKPVQPQLHRLPVCDTHRINRHKVFAGLAQRGKTSEVVSLQAAPCFQQRQ